MAKKNLDFLFSAPIAHRGLHGGGRPENSLLAFGAAVRGGYIIELDIHLLSDGAVAVFHDDNLGRMCGADVDIKDLTTRKIGKYKLANTDERIPLLKDVLALVNGAVPIIIELKNDALTGKLERALRPLLNDYRGDYALKSFNPLTVRRLRKMFRNAPIGQLYSSTMLGSVSGIRNWLLKRALVWSLWRSDFVSVSLRDLESSTIVSLHEFGKPILAWTVRSSDERVAAMRLADNCICEKII